MFCVLIFSQVAQTFFTQRRKVFRNARKDLNFLRTLREKLRVSVVKIYLFFLLSQIMQIELILIINLPNLLYLRGFNFSVFSVKTSVCTVFKISRRLYSFFHAKAQRFYAKNYSKA